MSATVVPVKPRPVNSSRAAIAILRRVSAARASLTGDW
jgi:hypothetical protein